MYIISYIGLQHILNSNTEGRSILIEPYDVRKFASKFNTVVFDEIAYAQNTTSITYKICRELSKVIPYRYGLTGRPFNRDPLALWGQFYVIDKGETLGTSINVYRQAFFKAKENKYLHYIEWKFDKSKEGQLNRIVKNRTIYYSKDECQDLPEKVVIPIHLKLDEESAAYYDSIRQQFISTLIENKDDANLLAKIKNPFAKMRQVCSGYVKVKDEETETEEILSFSNPKEQMLEQLVLDLPDDCKMIIFYDYTPSGERIVAQLQKLKIKYEWLYGGTTDKPEAINRFKTDSRCRSTSMQSKVWSYRT